MRFKAFARFRTDVYLQFRLYTEMEVNSSEN